MLDLGNALDFAKATVSDASGLLQLFTGRDPKEWDIQEGSYNGVVFHVFRSKESYNGALSQVNDQGGRRKVKFVYPYRDGQTTSDLGALAEDFEFDILLFGTNYMNGFNKLMRELNKPTPGDLVHPVRGKLRVVPTSWTVTHSSEQRKALSLRVMFSEHNFTIGDFTALKDSSVKSALTSAIEFFAKIESYIVHVQGLIQFGRDVIAAVSALLSRYQTNYATTLTRLNQTFNGGTSVDIPGLLPVNGGGVGQGSGGSVTVAGSSGATVSQGASAADATFPIAYAPSDPFVAVPTSVVSAETSLAIAVTEITKEVNALRVELQTVIDAMEAAGGGEGSLEFYDDIIGLKQSAVVMQQILERGIASSQAQIVSYVTPQIMNIREIAFANGLDVDRAGDIDLLNPALESVNYVPKGTAVQVPKS